MKYFIANWKANKNIGEALAWCSAFKSKYVAKDDVVAVICPPFPFLNDLKKELAGLKNIFIGSQTVSSIEKGSFTGEVTALNLVGLATYSIIGHSERRKNFGEIDEDLAKKTFLAKQYGLEPIYCIRDEKDIVPPDVKLVAYEPVAAIGTGQNESPEKVVEMKKKLNLQDKVFIYGGSVNEENVKSYLATGEIDGFLIGGASLDGERFVKIINQS